MTDDIPSAKSILAQYVAFASVPDQEMYSGSDLASLGKEEFRLSSSLRGDAGKT